MSNDGIHSLPHVPSLLGHEKAAVSDGDASGTDGFSLDGQLAPYIESQLRVNARYKRATAQTISTMSAWVRVDWDNRPFANTPTGSWPAVPTTAGILVPVAGLYLIVFSVKITFTTAVDKLVQLRLRSPQLGISVQGQQSWVIGNSISKIQTNQWLQLRTVMPWAAGLRVFADIWQDQSTSFLVAIDSWLAFARLMKN